MLNKHQSSAVLLDATLALGVGADLLREFDMKRSEIASNRVQAIEELLQDCEKLLASVRSEPVRTIHHFACTGGTLIAKCVAAMPNTQVLSEVDPLSRMTDNRTFAPTDMVKLARASTRPVDSGLLIDIFLRSLSAIYDDAHDKGVRLVLRDHAHSQFCVQHYAGDRPTLREIVGQQYRTRSVVTVRHPLDSYLSLVKNRWLTFEPQTIEEYVQRYLAFLDRYEGCPTFRYEDIVANPVTTVAELCAALDLPFNNSFAETFSIYQLSGDSGRRGSIISARPRRAAPEDLAAEAARSAGMIKLCRRLRYE